MKIAAIVLGALLSSFLSFADAQETLPLLEEAPCGWFVKAAPYVWRTDHAIRVDTWGMIAGPLAVSPGMYRVDDGTDAYELIERKCGGGSRGLPVERTAMPLPFGLLPWYK